MFKKFKHAITLALPVATLALTSCGNSPKTINYQQMRRFAAETYDSHALDTIPVDYVANFNKMEAKVLVEYSTPTGGSDSFNISFGHGGIHVTLKDHYAYSLSSTVIDTIEKYYSDFVSLAVTLQKEPPLEMFYQLLGGNCSKVDLTTNRTLAGDVAVRLLQMFTNSIDLLASAIGYMPIEVLTGDVPPKTEMGKLVVYVAQMLMGMLGDKMGPQILMYFFMYMNYFTLTVSDSSESHGDVFNTYVIADNNGFIKTLDFNFKSSFVISGLAAFKKYDKANPEEGDKPVTTEAPYHFTLTGSYDFDFDVSSQYVK